MKRSDVFPSSYIGKDDVQSPVIARIKEVIQEMVSGDDTKENKPVMHFADSNLKPMILNTTNWTVCEEAYGLDSDDWTGKPVEIYVDPSVMYAGKRVGGVRLRIPNGQAHSNIGALAPAKEVWGFAQAIEKVGVHGITREQLVAKLKENGITGWQSETCTPIAMQMCDDAIPF